MGSNPTLSAKIFPFIFIDLPKHRKSLYLPYTLAPTYTRADTVTAHPPRCFVEAALIRRSILAPGTNNILGDEVSQDRDLTVRHQPSVSDTPLTSDCRSVVTSEYWAIPALWLAHRARNSLRPACCAGTARFRMRARCSGYGRMATPGRFISSRS